MDQLSNIYSTMNDNSNVRHMNNNYNSGIPSSSGSGSGSTDAIEHEVDVALMEMMCGDVSWDCKKGGFAESAITGGAEALLGGLTMYDHTTSHQTNMHNKELLSLSYQPGYSSWDQTSSHPSISINTPAPAPSSPELMPLPPSLQIPPPCPSSSLSFNHFFNNISKAKVTVKPTVTILPQTVAASTSTENALPSPAEDRKRKGKEIIKVGDDDLEVQEIANAKSRISKSTPAKRNRATEQHRLSERRRRDNISSKIDVLLNRVPDCPKVNMAAMLDKVINYVDSLERQVESHDQQMGSLKQEANSFKQQVDSLKQRVKQLERRRQIQTTQRSYVVSIFMPQPPLQNQVVEQSDGTSSGDREAENPGNHQSCCLESLYLISLLYC